MAILMSSSKAISISRRKSKLLVILLLLPVFLWAEPYRAAIVTDNPGYQGVLEDALLLLSGDVTSQTAIEARREKDERLKKIEREKSISQARQDEKSPSENAETAAEEETLSLELVTLELSDDARSFIAETAYDPAYGARPLKRWIQHNLETKLARAVISGEIRDGWKVRVVVDRTEDGGTLRFERVEE